MARRRRPDISGDRLVAVELGDRFEEVRYPGGWTQPKGAVLHVIFNGESRQIKTSLACGQQALDGLRKRP